MRHATEEEKSPRPKSPALFDLLNDQESENFSTVIMFLQVFDENLINFVLEQLGENGKSSKAPIVYLIVSNQLSVLNQM